MSESVAALLSAKAVRERCHELLNLADGDELDHFRVDRSRMDDVASFVVDTRERYPDLKVPFHSRWRHFEIDGVSRWPEISEPISFAGPQEAGRVAFELAIVSVLLDAGAGPEWKYRDRARTDLVEVRRSRDGQLRCLREWGFWERRQGGRGC